MALLVGALTVLPCNDAILEQQAMQVESGHHDHSHLAHPFEQDSEECQDCSPFCLCHCNPSSLSSVFSVQVAQPYFFMLSQVVVSHNWTAPEVEAQSIFRPPRSV